MGENNKEMIDNLKDQVKAYIENVNKEIYFDSEHIYQRISDGFLLMIEKRK